MLQRIFDFVFSFLALLILAPLLIPVACILKFTGEGEIFYRQMRIGQNGSLFGVLKFATMLKDSPNIGTGTITVKHDPRVLPFGRFLRKTKINELPQLLNILSGKMSVIGPRPLTMETFNAYPELVKNKITSVRPGLSGVGSIVFRDEESLLQDADNASEFYENVIAPYKGKLELWYVDNRNILVYFLLIISTIYVLISPKSKFLWSLLRDLPLPEDERLKFR